MNDVNDTPQRTEGTAKILLRYFIQGVLVLAPIVLTIYIIYWLFSWVDHLLRPFVSVPGLGFLIIMVSIMFIGWVSSHIIIESIISFFDEWLERTPGIKLIYKSIKDFFQAFAGEKRKFTKPVLANVFANDVWIIGFITDEEMKKFDMGEEMVGVYVPQAYNFAGQLYILPKEKVRMIDKITATDAMKYTVTGGVIETAEKAPIHNAAHS